VAVESGRSDVRLRGNQCCDNELVMCIPFPCTDRPHSRAVRHYFSMELSSRRYKLQTQAASIRIPNAFDEVGEH